MKYRYIIALIFMAFTLIGCGDSRPVSTAEPVEGPVGMPNPTLAFCKEQGYRYEFRTLREPAIEVETPIPTGEDGEGSKALPPREIDSGISYTVCIFPDGTECEIGAFFRGECLPGQFEHAEEGLPVINAVQEAGLDQAVVLDILELSQDSLGEAYVHLLTINDDHLLDQIVNALDAPIWTYSGIDCVTPYRLEFRLTDGSVQKFDYHLRWDRMTSVDYGDVCHPNQASILAGDQEFLAGNSGAPPGAFDVLIKGLIASSWAASINLSERLELDRAVEIEILETLLIEGLNDKGEHTLDVEVVTRMKTNDPQAIRQLVAVLDNEFEFVSRVGFHTPFELRFILDDGTIRILGYGSEGDRPTVLRGALTIWQGRDILPGPEFDVLFKDLLASAQDEQ